MKHDANYLEKHLNEYKEQIKEIGRNISYNDTSANAIDSINNIYKYLKEIVDDFYNKETNTINKPYNQLISITYDIRNNISNKFYIIPPTDFYKYKENFHHNYNTNIDEGRLLDFIIHETYKIYQKEYVHFYPDNFEVYDLTNGCYKISKIVKALCEEQHIKCQTIKMDAGFSNSAFLFNGCRFYYFNIIELNNKQYLIDCSYKQFFLAKRNMIGSLGIPNFTTPLAGIYMMMDNERTKVAKEILKNGYILITPNNFKHYFDGFTLSFRNGLYYEDKELLGYQKRPLKNSNFRFKIK